jgi:predicted ATPase/DNA-binding SARP family transcriptional activator
MELRILGPVEIASRETVRRVRGRLLTLLSLLLVERGNPVGVDRVVDALWGDRPPANPRNGVQVLVTRLRAELGEDAAVMLTAAGYVLIAPEGAIDADRFETLLTRGRAELAAGDNAAAAVTLRDALTLWRGPALAETRDEPFARAEAGRLEELRLEALEARIEGDLALGGAGELVGELTALVAEHPFREHLYGSLMLALSRSGRQADALAAFTAARHALSEGLGLEPGPRLRELQRAVLTQDDSTVARPARPEPALGVWAPSTPAVGFVGRRAELTEVTGLLLRGQRVLTLVGPGGAGKTRLAFEAAGGLRDAFPDGVAVVELAPFRSAAQVEGAITRALSSGDALEPSLKAVAERLSGRQCLVVLDNAEHVREHAAVAAATLTATDGPRVLATSRVRLGLREEVAYEVPPLSPADAVSLFVACARRLDASFAATDAVPLLCARLDGLPLAIELAAARTGVFSPAQLLERIGESLDLVDADGEHEERHRSLSAATDWSLSHLSDEELRVFRQLGVFAGAVTWEAIEAVCETSPAVLRTLVERSLVRRYTPATPGEVPLFGMLETIRQHAAELLSAFPDEEALARRRHAVSVAARMQSLAESNAPPVEFERERAELGRALDAARSLTDGELELTLAAAAHRLWRLRGPYQEGVDALERALARSPHGQARVRGLLAAGDLSSLSGSWRHARERAEAALAEARAAGDTASQARALNLLGNAAFGAADYETARARYEDAIAVPRVEEPGALLAPLANLGHTLFELGARDDARDRLEECLAAALRIDDRQRASACLHSLGMLALDAGCVDDADATLRRGLVIAHDLGIVKYQIDILAVLGPVRVAAGDVELGVRILACADAHAAVMGMRTTTEGGREAAIHRESARAAMGQLGPSAFELAYAAGRSWSLDEGVRAALTPTVAPLST